MDQFQSNQDALIPPPRGIPAWKMYSLYGLNVRSELALTADTCPDQDAAVDLELSVGQDFEHDPEPEGKLIYRRAFDDGCWSEIWHGSKGHTYRLSGDCEFRLSADLRRATVHSVPGADPALVSLCATTNLMNIELVLRGESVLHASAVDVGGSALAFVGAAGMGKSTMAALFCAHGARLITDDLLRLRRAGDQFSCYSGPPELRLRKSAAALVERFPQAQSAPTADGRLGLRPDRVCDQLPRLHAIIVPMPSRTVRALRLEELTGSNAAVRLNQFPRDLGWQEPAPIGRYFEWTCAIARTVPIWQAEMPWGPPFQAELVDHLSAGVGLPIGENHS